MIYWRGVHKLNEEMGEVLQITGKLGPFPNGHHPDGKGHLLLRLEEELADLQAAIDYLVENSEINPARMLVRKHEKLEKFRQWGLTGYCDCEEQK